MIVYNARQHVESSSLTNHQKKKIQCSEDFQKLQVSRLTRNFRKNDKSLDLLEKKYFER